MSLPQITMTGRLTADPELRFTPNGRALATFTIATNDRVKNGDQWVDGPACFLECTVWAGKAEAAAETLRKGMLATVVGRLEQQSWETSDGSKRSKHAVKVDEVAATVVAPSSGGRGAGWDADRHHGGAKSDPWAEQPQQSFTPPF